MDPTGLQALPASEFRKRRDYWLAWRKVTSKEKDTSIPGVTVEEWDDREVGATTIES